MPPVVSDLKPKSRFRAFFTISLLSKLVKMNGVKDQLQQMVFIELICCTDVAQ